MKDSTENKAQLEYETAFFEQLISSKPDHIEALSALAEIYTKSGRVQEGLILDKKLSLLLPTDDTVFYNLSCSYSLLGELEKSLSAIKEAFNLGYNDIDHLKQDSDLANLRNDPNFSQKLISFIQNFKS